MSLFTELFHVCGGMLSIDFEFQVKQKVTGTSLLVQTLEEEVTYTFAVRAQTIDYGPATIGNITTGPQEGSPARPKELQLGKTFSGIDLHWSNGPSGKGPILGYYIQSKRKGTFGNLLFSQIYYLDITITTIIFQMIQGGKPSREQITDILKNSLFLTKTYCLQLLISSEL